MRTVKKPETRKQEILEGAMAVFLRKGYEKTTIADISKELGISQGLCYRYFVSKEEIYHAVVECYASMIARENLKNRPDQQPIRQWIDSIPDMLRNMKLAEGEHPGFYALIHTPGNEKIHGELCLSLVEKLLPSVTAVLVQANKAGEVHLTDCQATAAFGLYGEAGLLMSEGMECTEAIQENWRRLLGIK